jgi:hypothetical protein
MTFQDRIRRGVRQAIDAARSGPGSRSRRVRIADPANVVVAHNVGGQGKVRAASAQQTVVVENDRVVERSERTEVDGG